MPSAKVPHGMDGDYDGNQAVLVAIVGWGRPSSQLSDVGIQYKLKELLKGSGNCGVSTEIVNTLLTSPERGQNCREEGRVVVQSHDPRSAHHAARIFRGAEVAWKENGKEPQSCDYRSLFAWRIDSATGDEVPYPGEKPFLIQAGAAAIIHRLENQS